MLASGLDKRFIAAVAGLGLKCTKIGYPWPGRIVLRKKGVDFVYVLGNRSLTIGGCQHLHLLRLLRQHVVFIREEEDINAYVDGLLDVKRRKTVFEDQKLF